MSPSLRRLPILLAAALLAAPAAAAEDAFEFYREEAQVTTASRRAEPAWRAPAAVDVVTAEDIRAYGFQHLWDALRYRVGMDVVDARSADGNRAIVSARGLTRDFVSEMQVLVDGRSVYSPFLGGVYWESLPVQMQDVERIEIVRGPNAALYGSNAALGVVNIITKKPGTGAEAEASAQAGDRSLGTAETAAAGGARGGLRMSHSYEQDESHPNASGAGDGDDFLHENKLNVRGRWSPDAATNLELFAGGSRQTLGIPGFPGNPQSKAEEHFALLRAERRLGGAGTAEASLARSEHDFDAGPVFVGRAVVRAYQYDAEVLHRFDWLDGRASSVWGGNWRLSVAESDQVFAGRPRQENRLARGYAHQSLRLSEAATAVVGVSVERTDTGGLAPAWQGALLLSPGDAQVFRLSYSHAPTIPPLFNKSGDYTVSPLVRIVGGPSLKPQEVDSWETGWSGRELDGALKTDVTLYLMTIRNRNFNYVQSAAPLPIVVGYDNRNAALARGAEVSVEYSPWRRAAAFANYTLERIQDAKGPTDFFGSDLRRETPVHKANVGARAALPRGVAAAATLGYKDAYRSLSSTRGTKTDVPRSFRLDLRVGWSPRPDWELFVAAQNLLQPYRVEHADMVASPREYEAGVRARFGP